MSASPERAVEEEAVLPGPDAATPQGGARGRGRSLTSALSLPSLTPVRPDGDPRSPWSPEAARAWLTARAVAVGARELDIIHGPPASLTAMHKRHQLAASHWNAPVLQKARLGWGLLHTAVAAIVLAALDAAFSPVGALLAVLFILAALNWL